MLNLAFKNLNKVLYLAFISILVVSCNSVQKKRITEQADLVITNVSLIDGTGSEAQQNVNIYVKDGRIIKINQDSEVKADSIIDSSGKYLIPGLFDNHFHFPYKRERAMRQLIHFGVTSIFNTGSSHTNYEEIQRLIRLENADSIVAPHIYYTSYYVTIPGAHPAKNIDAEKATITGNISLEGNEHIYLIKSDDDIPRFVNEAKKGGAFAMKLIIEDGPAPPMVERISQNYVDIVVKEAKKQNLKVFAHISDTIEMQMGLRAGVDGFLHSLTTRHYWGETNSELVEQIIQDSIYLVTTNMLLKSALYPFNPEWRQTEDWQVYENDQIAEIDAFEPVFKGQVEPMLKHYLGLENFKIEELKPFLENFRLLYENRVMLVAGTDVGALAYIQPGHSIHEELQLLQLGGMNPRDILRCATLNPAKMLGVDDDYGSLKIGKVADMILLDKNPLVDISNTLSINTVFKRGKIQPRIIHD